ncbi:hypothetical protein SDC9_204442 [bioreactor metagenome]|uniref:Uncharacterized protein n=1 Tax=bioreactor metagenome TaxID=1076179 RepID=A0A645J0R5_9ZZZZ
MTVAVYGKVRQAIVSVKIPGHILTQDNDISVLYRSPVIGNQSLPACLIYCG